MSSKFNNSLELLETAEKELLYENLILQLEKDFKRANLTLSLGSEPSPDTVKTVLHEKMYVLLLERFTDFLNLLYVIDVSEKEVANLKSSDAVDRAAEVAFLILKREWQKVWLRRRFSP